MKKEEDRQKVSEKERCWVRWNIDPESPFELKIYVTCMQKWCIKTKWERETMWLTKNLPFQTFFSALMPYTVTLLAYFEIFSSFWVPAISALTRSVENFIIAQINLQRFAFLINVKKSKRAKSNSPTGNRTRVFRVKAEYPNRLDYRGKCTCHRKSLSLIPGLLTVLWQALYQMPSTLHLHRIFQRLSFSFFNMFVAKSFI